MKLSEPIDDEFDEHGCRIGEEEWDSELEKCMPIHEDEEQPKEQKPTETLDKEPFKVIEYSLDLVEGTNWLTEWAQWLKRFNAAMDATEIIECKSEPGFIHIEKKRLTETVYAMNGALNSMVQTWGKCAELFVDCDRLHKIATSSQHATIEALKVVRNQQKILDQTYAENNAIRETVCRIEENFLPKERRTRLRETLESGTLSLKDRVENLKGKIPPKFKATPELVEESGDDDVVMQPYK